MMDQFVQQIKDSQYIVFFGGAGTSTESQIPDFRTADGLYQKNQDWPHPPETMLSKKFFNANPQQFFAYYRQNLLYPNAKPNGAHRALAQLEAMGKVKAVITQNIDGLHQAAGSQEVIELHGSVHRNYCISCGKRYNLKETLALHGIAPKCPACNGIVRPDVVLYQEGLDQDVLQAAINHILQADMLIVGGTSLIVYPAAGLLRYFDGDHLVLINKDQTRADKKAGLVFRQPIGAFLEEVMTHVGV